MPQSARKDKRHPAHYTLLVRCESWDDFVERYASDVSSGGMFIVTDDPPPVLSVVEVKMHLPEGHEVRLRARAVHVVELEAAAARGTHPGVGVQFEGLDELLKQQVQQLVDFARRQGSNASEASLASHLFEHAASLPPSEVMRSLRPSKRIGGRTTASPSITSGAAGTSTRPTKKRRRTGPGTMGGRSGRPTEPGPSATSAAPKPRPSDPAQLKVALSHIAHRRHQEAVRAFEKMLADNPGDTEASKWIHVARARWCCDQSDEAGAAGEYRQALELDENNHEARKFVREYELKRRLNAIPFGRFFVKSKPPG